MTQAGLLIGRRYELLNVIGTGGMGVVYRAHDRLTDSLVALKQVTAPQRMADETTLAEYRLALAQEFKMLASLRHPHIISVLDYGFIEPTAENPVRQPFFTMDYVENAQIITHAAKALSIQQRIQLLAQLLEALVYLHRRGILHRDLKPANVLVAEGQVRLLDFGLSAMRAQAGDPQNRGKGTLAYMAPEVLQDYPASEASDLYAVGVMTYELLTGEHPFDTANIVNLMRDILNTMPDVSVIDVDEALSVTIGRLLAKAPSSRFTDAAEVLAIYSTAIPGGKLHDTRATQDSYLQAAQFVGRDDELGQLVGALNRLHPNATSAGSAWLVSGESGVGKSRLLEELRIIALVSGIPVVRGQAIIERGGLYRLWHEVFRRVVLMTTLTDEEAGVLKPFVPDMDTLLGRQVAVAEALDPQAAQRRVLEVVQTVLVRFMREEGQPLLIVLEDIHWAGSEGLLLLNDLTARLVEWPLMIVASCRDDERPELPAELPHMRLLRLPRLDEDSIAVLSASMLGEAGRLPEVVNLLQRETEGNVFFMVEVARALAEDAGDLGLIGTRTLPRSVFAGGIRLVVQRRLQRIPPEARPLLNMAAVAGRQLDPELLLWLAPNADLDRWLALCTSAAVLAVGESGARGGGWQFAHDKLREGVLAELEPEQRRDLHRQVAEALEAIAADPRGEAARLAYHWGMAGDVMRELFYTSMAGEEAINNSATREAADYFERGLTLLEQLPPYDGKDQQEIQCLIALGAARMALRGYAAPEVEETYSRARELARSLGDTPYMSQVLANLSGYYIGRGDYQTAGDLGLEMLLRAEQSGSQTGEMWAHLILGQALGFMGEHEAAARHLEGMLRQYDPTRRRNIRRSAVHDFGVAALEFLGVTRWLMGYPDQALELGRHAVQIAKDLQHPMSQVFALHWTSIIHFYRGEFEACYRLSGEAAALAEANNYGLFIALTTMFRAMIGTSLGLPPDTMRAQLENGLAAYEATGAEFTVPFFLTHLAYLQAQAGEHHMARLTLEKAFAVMERLREYWYLSEFYCHQGEILLLSGETPDAAEAAFLKALTAAQQRGANSMTLRAGLHLARLWQREGRVGEACEVLTPLVEPFTEGFDTHDLRLAHDLLAQLQ
ncbi:MAG: protein kinase [bacterium]|nr:protein kinase [bacterium]